MKQYKLPTGKIFGLIAIPEIVTLDDTQPSVELITPLGTIDVSRSIVEHSGYFEEIKEEKKGRCLTEPKRGTCVFYIDAFDGICSCNYHTESRYEAFDCGLLFWDEESCGKEIERLKVLQELRVLAGGFEPDWNDAEQVKYHIGSFRTEFFPAKAQIYHDIGQIYFETEEARDNAIEKLGSRLDILLD